MCLSFDTPPFYFSSRTSISNLGYIISNLDTYVIIIPATFVSL